jgi:hypothetical protein
MAIDKELIHGAINELMKELKLASAEAIMDNKTALARLKASINRGNAAIDALYEEGQTNERA